MSGRSFLCDLWFSQTLRHKNYIYYIYDAYVKLDNYIPKSGTQQDVTNPRKYFNSA